MSSASDAATTSGKVGSTMDDKPKRRGRWKRFLLGVLLFGVLGGVCFGGWATWTVRSSLPLLDGTKRVEGLVQEVTIDRDNLGVPTIHSTSRTDTAFALGFIHAQDRFFQMDLLRRVSSGRISELVGAGALGSDSQFRKHRFGQLATQVVALMPESHRKILAAYTKGVNSGLMELGGRPFEYLFLGQAPQPWKETDSILVMMTMMCDLQPMDAGPELGLGMLAETVPDELFRFLVRPGSQWDAALDDSMLPQPPIPPAEVFSMHQASMGTSRMADARGIPVDQRFGKVDEEDLDFRVGSNNWAVGKGAGHDGRAILASDMHLGLRVPATWYRTVMNTPTMDGTVRRLVGVTLPGAPVLIEGSNGSVAWGFTNSYGDYGDVIELKFTPGSTSEYLTPDGPKTLERFTEEVQFPKGNTTVDYEWSVWGPVVLTRENRKFVHKWTGNDPAAFDLNLMELESAHNVQETMDLANRAGMPNQNVMITDTEGNIGWTLSGKIPKRPDTPPIVPVDWSEGNGIWQGYLDPSQHPRVYNPSDSRLWTANNRILGGEFLEVVGDGRYDPGARARQIRDRLREKEALDEKDLLAIQLDDEARFLKSWRERLLSVCKNDPQPVSDEFVRHVEQSSDRASVDAIGYRVVHEFRSQVFAAIYGIGSRRNHSDASSPTGLAKMIGRGSLGPISYEDVVEQLLVERPTHWLPTEFESWDALLSHAATATEELLSANQPLSKATWGIRNRAAIQHPLSMAVSSLASILDMPSVELPGDNHMPRVQSPSGGASERMVVSPGKEELGIYHQPGGQSGHPFSPYYRAGFEDWALGNASPLLPGPSQHQLKLVPN